MTHDKDPRDAAQIPTLEPLTMPIEEAMRTQRALCRRRPDPVDDALVLCLIELALKAPTGRTPLVSKSCAGTGPETPACAVPHSGAVMASHWR
jgi:hypothetical protein